MHVLGVQLNLCLCFNKCTTLLHFSPHRLAELCVSQTLSSLHPAGSFVMSEDFVQGSYRRKWSSCGWQLPRLNRVHTSMHLKDTSPAMCYMRGRATADNIPTE